MRGDWQQKSLSEVCEIVNGGTPDTSKADYWGGKHLWITPAEMGKRLSPFVEETSRKLTDEGMRNSSANPLPPYSVILSSRAPIGHLVINTKPMSTNQGCKGLIPNNKLYYKFLYYFLYANVDLLNALGTGTTFKELSGGKLKEVLIPLPPLSEQQRFVAILDQAFAAIETARANTEKNLQIVRELFDTYLDNVFLRENSDWHHKRLADICEVKDGTHFSPKNNHLGKYKYITAKNIKPYLLDISNVTFISEEDHNQIYKRCNVEKGDVLYIKDGATAGAATINPLEEQFSLLSSVALFKLKNEILNTFLIFYLNSRVGKTNFLSNVDGAAITRLTIEKLKEKIIPFPSIDSQNELVQKISNMFEKTKQLEDSYRQKLVELGNLKKSILQKAFNGEL